MSGYDNPVLVPYFRTIDMAAAAADLSLPIPLGARQARVVDMQAVVTEAVVGTTSAPVLDVGYSGNAEALATLTVPDGTAVGAVLNSRSPTYSHNGIYQAGGTVAEQDALLVTITDAVGGVIAGTVDVMILVAFDWTDQAD